MVVWLSGWGCDGSSFRRLLEYGKGSVCYKTVSLDVEMRGVIEHAVQLQPLTMTVLAVEQMRSNWEMDTASC